MMLGSMENPRACTSLLACPVCGRALADAGRDDSGRGGSARCSEGHSFDYARSGYLNLSRRSGRGRAGDTAEMVRARTGFLATGHYGPVAEAVAGTASEAMADGVGAQAGESPPGAPLVAEIGCGTAYHLATVVRTLTEEARAPNCAYGFDLSKPAVDRAARDHPDLRFAVADVEVAVPLLDSSADLVLSAFAPRPAAELGRVTKPGGSLVAAFAGPRHLERLRARLDLLAVGEDKLERLTERLDPWFELLTTTPVDYDLELTAAEADRLILMGPNAWHRSNRTALDGPLTDLVSIAIARFRRR
jgi:23S rRNA (guanine745-N1)-methyltransferase